MKPGESVDALFDHFDKIVSDLQYVDVTYSDSDNARQIYNIPFWIGSDEQL